MIVFPIGKDVLLASIHAVSGAMVNVVVSEDGKTMAIEPYVAPAMLEDRLKVAHSILLEQAPLKLYKPDGPAIPDPDAIRRGAIGTGWGLTAMGRILSRWMNISANEASDIIAHLMADGMIVFARPVNGGCGVWDEYGAIENNDN